MANFLRTHTAEQARLNVAALASLTEYQHKCAALPSAAGGAAAAPGLGPRRSAGSSTNGGTPPSPNPNPNPHPHPTLTLTPYLLTCRK